MAKAKKIKYHVEGNRYVDEQGQTVDPHDIPPDLKKGIVFGFEYGPIELTNY